MCVSGTRGESGIWLIVWFQLHMGTPATYTHTRMQTVLAYVIEQALAVFTALKHVYELTYTRHKGLIVCLKGLILIVFLLLL